LARGRHGLEEPRLNGNVIIGELIRNMEIGRFEMAFTVLLPCVFTIYLNPDDYATLTGVFDLVIDDARRALRARVAELNAPGVRGKRRTVNKEHKIACREWQLEFLPEAEVPAGDVEIHSKLNEVVPAGFRGTRTTLIGREPVITQRLAAGESSAASEAPIYATLHYQDDSGPQTYFITQNQVRIGRGGEEQPVDLAIRSTDEVSRQHLLIRRDPATGVFSALDASTNGTWVNGRRLLKGAEDRLPARARIGLGEVFTLLFEVRA
jgi:FHA domain